MRKHSAICGALAVAATLLTGCEHFTPAHPDPMEIWGSPRYPETEKASPGGESEAQERQAEASAPEQPPNTEQPPPSDQPAPSEQQPPPDEKPSTQTSESLLETSRRQVRSATEWLATGVDSW